jgi:protein TonB
MKRIRLAVFPVVALLHVFLIFFLVFTMNTIASEVEPVADIMKLVDVQEETPPPPPPEEEVPPSEQNTVEAVATNMKAVDEVPQQTVVSSVPRPVVQTQEIEYLPAHKISQAPKFPDLSNRFVYPPIAQRSGVEGMVILDMFIDAQGNIQRIEVLKEDPPGRGFAEAALNAFRGVKAAPAEANGKAVATRYRYPVRFAIKKNR